MQTLARIAAAFPVPAYLAMPGAGIDISGNSVKAVILAPRQSGAALVSYRTTPLPPEAVVGGEIEKPDPLVEVLRLLRSKDRVHYAHASLSERKAYLYETIVPPGEDMKSAVEFELEAHVPLPPSELIFDFERVRAIEQGTVVAVTAYARRIIDEYAAAFAKAGIMLRSLEVESQAVARAVATPALRSAVALVVDFGRTTTRMVILDHGVAAFTATIDVGGDSLTAAIMKAKGVPAGEAETIKNTQGFLEGAGNRDLYESMLSTISVLKDEIAKHVAYWSTPAEGVPPRLPVERLVMIGGNANVKGLPQYLSRALELPVTIGNVWANAFSFDDYVPAMPATESLEYAAAIGLALRSATHAVW